MPIPVQRSFRAMEKSRHDKPAVVFDLFGTLLDVSRLADEPELAALPDAPSFVRSWREKQLTYAFLCAAMGTYRDFDSLTEAALHYASSLHGVKLSTESITSLCAAWLALPPYADVAETLQALIDQGLTCAVATNGTLTTAIRTLENSRLRSSISTVLSADEVHTLKPSPAIYASIAARLQREPHDCLFITSNGWDAIGAATFGLSVVWCNRLNMPAETIGPTPHATIRNLAELPALIAHLRS